MEQHRRSNPEKTWKSRIKRLTETGKVKDNGGPLSNPFLFSHQTNVKKSNQDFDIDIPLKNEYNISLFHMKLLKFFLQV